MTAIVTSPDSNVLSIAGCGLSVTEDFELSAGVLVRPNPPRHDMKVVADGCSSVGEYAIVLSMMEFATFFLEIKGDGKPEELAVKAWNSLWLFHLLSLACLSPCVPLYCWSGLEMVGFSLATPLVNFRRPPHFKAAAKEQLEWARNFQRNFELLQADDAFTKSLLSWGNSHHLFGVDSRIMQLWSGIECLFKVSSELSRTLALYAALILERSPEARFACYKQVRKDYDVRSKVVHGSIGKGQKLDDAYGRASEILVRLLARCVELGRVPTAEELDRAALFGAISD
jgi:hypothetical protein